MHSGVDLHVGGALHGGVRRRPFPIKSPPGTAMFVPERWRGAESFKGGVRGGRRASSLTVIAAAIAGTAAVMIAAAVQWI